MHQCYLRKLKESICRFQSKPLIRRFLPNSEWIMKETEFCSLDKCTTFCLFRLLWCISSSSSHSFLSIFCQFFPLFGKKLSKIKDQRFMWCWKKLLESCYNDFLSFRLESFSRLTNKLLDVRTIKVSNSDVFFIKSWQICDWNNDHLRSCYLSNLLSFMVVET